MAWFERGVIARGRGLKSDMPTTVICRIELGALMVVMIGVDPHKGSHTAVAVDGTEQCLGELRVQSGPGQADRLVEWAASFPERTWAIENAAGLGHLLAQQLVAAGEWVVDVQPKLAARVRLWAPKQPTRTIPMTHARWPSPRCGRRRRGRCGPRTTPQ